MPRPSPISDTPISSRNDSASTLIVGCRLTNWLIGSAENIMMATARTTAATMIARSSAMPTAVITESSENTMSSSMICTMTAPNDGAARAELVSFVALEPLVNLERRLGEQEQAAADQDQVASRDPAAEHREQRRGQADDPGDREQQRDAHDHRGQQARCAARAAAGRAGSLPERIEMKMTLSTPSTISRNVSVTSASRPADVKNASICYGYGLKCLERYASSTG